MGIIPDEPVPVNRTFSDRTVLLYGPPKIGKTTFASQFPDAVFSECEPGLGELALRKTPCYSWPAFLEWCNDLRKRAKAESDAAAFNEAADGIVAPPLPGAPIKTVVIDTVDNAYRYCEEHVLKGLGVDHASDLGYGKGWAAVHSEWHRVITKLASLHYGLVMISHAKTTVVKAKNGSEYDRQVPTLPGKARETVMGLVDVILYCEIAAIDQGDGTVKYRRVMRAKPATTYEAGDRTGKLPATMELSFEAFRKALDGDTQTGKETT